MSVFSRLKAFLKQGEPEEFPAPRPIVEVPAFRKSDQSEKLRSGPHFRTTANDRNYGEDGNDVRIRLRNVFMPSQPVESRNVFAGRLPVLTRIIEGVEDQRTHILLYGERGIGKTSLLRVFAEIAQEAGYLIVHESCSSTSAFETAFRAAAEQIPSLYYGGVSLAQNQGSQRVSLADFIPMTATGPTPFSRALSEVKGTRVIIILDEFDRAEEKEFQPHVAELIKNLSDSAARVQLVIAGVADNLRNLLNHSPSIRRNLLAIHVDRMDDSEIEELISLGEQHAMLTFEPSAKEEIVKLSHGRPHLARLICHHASLNVLGSGRATVGVSDVATALSRVVSEMEARLATDTRIAAKEMVTSHPTEAALAARFSVSGDASFGVEDLLADSRLTRDQLYALVERFSASGLVIRNGADAPRFRFAEEGLASYLLLASEGARRACLSSAHVK